MVADVLAATSVVINAAGNALGWGVVVPLYAWAILKTRALPRWIGWQGLVVAAFAGWLGLFAPLERGQLDLVVRFSGVLPFFALQRDCDAAPTGGAAAAPGSRAALTPRIRSGLAVNRCEGSGPRSATGSSARCAPEDSKLAAECGSFLAGGLLPPSGRSQAS